MCQTLQVISLLLTIPSLLIRSNILLKAFAFKKWIFLNSL